MITHTTAIPTKPRTIRLNPGSFHANRAPKTTSSRPIKMSRIARVRDKGIIVHISVVMVLMILGEEYIMDAFAGVEID